MTIGDAERERWPYLPGANIIPISPGFVPAHTDGWFARYPTPIVVDYKQQLEYLVGLVALVSRDASDELHVTLQELRCTPELDRTDPTVTFTFGGVVDDEASSDLARMIHSQTTGD